MTKDDLIKTLKDDLEIQKEIVALKAVKEPPPDIPPYEGQAIPGMCSLLGEIIQEGKVWYVTKKNVGCFMSLSGTGTCESLPRDKYLNFMVGQNEMYRMHKDDETVRSYHMKIEEFFKSPEHTGTGIVVGPRLGRDELTYTFPYAKLMEIGDQIKPTAEYINSYSPL